MKANRRTRQTATIVTVITARLVLAAPAQAAPEATASKLPERHDYFGAMLDVGAPDLLGLSVIVRPLRCLRLHAGAMTNAAGFGLRGGVTYVPFDYWISPSLTVEGGHMFDGNANWMTRRFGVESPMLKNVGYSFASAHLGIELGSSNGFMFFIHAGMTLLVSRIQGVQEQFEQELTDAEMTLTDPWFRYIGPSAKIGFIIHI